MGVCVEMSGKGCRTFEEFGNGDYEWIFTLVRQQQPDGEMKITRLDVAYDDFYKKYGIIHSQTNKRYFSEDVSYNLVAGLEKSYDKTKLLAKSDIFTKRTIVPPKAVKKNKKKQKKNKHSAKSGQSCRHGT